MTIEELRDWHKLQATSHARAAKIASAKAIEPRISGRRSSFYALDADSMYRLALFHQAAYEVLNHG